METGDSQSRKAAEGLALVDTWSWLVCSDRPRLSLSSRGPALVMLAGPGSTCPWAALGLEGLTTALGDAGWPSLGLARSG